MPDALIKNQFDRAAAGPIPRPAAADRARPEARATPPGGRPAAACLPPAPTPFRVFDTERRT